MENKDMSTQEFLNVKSEDVINDLRANYANLVTQNIVLSRQLKQLTVGYAALMDLLHDGAPELYEKAIKKGVDADGRSN